MDTDLSSDIRGVSKDIYRRILDLAANVVDDDARRWHVMQAIFEHAIHHLDGEHRGLAITYAKLLRQHEDGFHALYEVEMRGTDPWPSSLECKAYLGSTTLAGRAAMSQHMQIWDNLDTRDRLPVVVDEYERSACAYPVMHAGRIAGVLIISSAQPGFFANLQESQAVSEYARLLALGLKESDFYSCSKLNLKPMPELKWQRVEISRSYMNRVIKYARQQKMTLPEAEEHVRRDMEEEFENIASANFLKK